MAEELVRKTIRAWRRENFLTLQELADMVGVRVQTLWNWENDRAMPAFRNIRALARALKIEPRQIILPTPRREPIAEN
jgi:transcriptional regulator with XRE-family HTH domain